MPCSIRTVLTDSIHVGVYTYSNSSRGACYHSCRCLDTVLIHNNYDMYMYTYMWCILIAIAAGIVELRNRLNSHMVTAVQRAALEQHSHCS
jgi:hypothetical protein